MKAVVRVLLCCIHSSSEATLREVDRAKDVSLEDSTLHEAVSVAVLPSESPEPEPRPATPREQIESPKDMQKVQEVPTQIRKGKKRPKLKKKIKESADLVKEDANMHSGRHVPQPRDAKPKKSILKRRQ